MNTENRSAFISTIMDSFKATLAVSGAVPPMITFCNIDDGEPDVENNTRHLSISSFLENGGEKMQRVATGLAIEYLRLQGHEGESGDLADEGIELFGGIDETFAVYMRGLTRKFGSNMVVFSVTLTEISMTPPEYFDGDLEEWKYIVECAEDGDPGVDEHVTKSLCFQWWSEDGDSDSRIIEYFKTTNGLFFGREVRHNPGVPVFVDGMFDEDLVAYIPSFLKVKNIDNEASR